jgi:DNA invertase Pin-like site-specific DNA recombinase
LIRTRTGEGREGAKARGVKLGRKPKLTEQQKREAIHRRDQDGEPVREIARTYKCQSQHDFKAYDMIKRKSYQSLTRGS